MRVLVNGLLASGARTGIGHYTAQLLRCLHEQADGAEIAAFPGPWLRWARTVAAGARACLVRRGRPRTAAQAGPGWRSRVAGVLRRWGERLLAGRFHAACRHGRFDLYHEPNFIPLPSDLPTIATFHDLSIVLHPEWHPADRVASFEKRLRPGLAQCRHILAISDAARHEIIRTFGFRPEQVTRTYMGVRPGLGPLPRATIRMELRRLCLPPRYLLYLGTIEPRKNLLTLLRAYCSLPEAVRGRYPLLLVGGWGWDVGPVASYLDREARQKGVHHLGYVPEGQLAVLYNGARALVYPSLYEGFGLPPVEMLACGGAVLASTAPALVETVGSQAHLVEATDIDGWRDALLHVCTDDDWWRWLRTGAEEAARPFTWERCAAETLAVYRRIAAGLDTPQPAAGSREQRLARSPACASS
jgi:alpha-1,3-rhamnosyl/mannosyltransferase